MHNSTKYKIDVECTSLGLILDLEPLLIIMNFVTMLQQSMENKRIINTTGDGINRVRRITKHRLSSSSYSGSLSKSLKPDRKYTNIVFLVQVFVL